MLLKTYVLFILLVQFGLLSDRLLRKSCSPGLRYDFLVYMYVPKCHFSFSYPSVYGVGISF